MLIRPLQLAFISIFLYYSALIALFLKINEIIFKMHRLKLIKLSLIILSNIWSKISPSACNQIELAVKHHTQLFLTLKILHRSLKGLAASYLIRQILSIKYQCQLNNIPINFLEKNRRKQLNLLRRFVRKETLIFY